MVLIILSIYYNIIMRTKHINPYGDKLRSLRESNNEESLKDIINKFDSYEYGVINNEDIIKLEDIYESKILTISMIRCVNINPYAIRSHRIPAKTQSIYYPKEKRYRQVYNPTISSPEVLYSLDTKWLEVDIKGVPKNKLSRNEISKELLKPNFHNIYWFDFPKFSLKEK